MTVSMAATSFYRSGPNRKIISRYLDSNLASPFFPLMSVPALVQAHSVDDIKPGNCFVATELGDSGRRYYYYGLEHNYFFPEHHLYVINTDNLTLFVIAEAVKRGDIEEGSSLFTCDAHQDIMSSSSWLQQECQDAWDKGDLERLAVLTALFVPATEQLQLALDLGLLKQRGTNLFVPQGIPGQGCKYQLNNPITGRIFGREFVYPLFPQKEYSRLPKKQKIAHVDIDFHASEAEDDLAFFATNVAIGNATTMSNSFRGIRESLFKEPNRVIREKVDQFGEWIRKIDFFEQAGLRIICVSPNCLNHLDTLWLTKEHVRWVTGE